jgi:hypothetical protein
MCKIGKIVFGRIGSRWFWEKVAQNVAQLSVLCQNYNIVLPVFKVEKNRATYDDTQKSAKNK